MNGRNNRVLILLQRPEAWGNLASIWSTLQLKPTFDPTVLVLPYNVEDRQVSTRMASMTRTLLESEGIPFEEWQEERALEKGEFDAVIINHPYDRERPRAFWFDKLSKSIPITIYIPYGLPMGGGGKNLRLQFAQPTQTSASAVVARSGWEKWMYARHCPSGDAHVHILGHPRFDRLLRKLETPVPHEMAEVINGRLTILWNSHFSFASSYSQSSNFSTFDIIGPELLQFAKMRREQLCLLWRPHPGLFPVIVHEGLLSRDEIATLRNELAHVGILLDESSNHLAAFKASDALLTDTGSFLLEYLVTRKPILALINREGEPLNEEASALVNHYTQASTPQDVIRFINDLAAGGTQLPDPTSAFPDHLPNLDDHTGERVVALLESLVTTGSRQPAVHAFTALEGTPLDHRDSHKVKGKVRCILNTTDAPETPILDKLIQGLCQLREHKAREASWKKKLRYVTNSIRTTLGETTKHHPLLMYAAKTLRRTKVG